MNELMEWYKNAQKSLVVESSDATLDTIVSRIDRGSLDISPKFQRRERWSNAKQSSLIESLLMNLPIPPIYLAQNDASGKFTVIDGKQRLTAINAFLSGDLVLSGLDGNQILNGLRFDGLPAAVQEGLTMKSLRLVQLTRQSNLNTVHEVFVRLNTGGERLNSQEIRNVAYSGPMNDAVYRMAENPFLRQQFKIQQTSESFKKMRDAEMVVRFLALNECWRHFSGVLSQTLDEFMGRHRFAAPDEILRAEKLFAESIDAAQEIWGESAFKRPGRNQVLAGLFDAEMVALASMKASSIESAKSRRMEIRDKTERLFAENSRFEQSVKQATNTPERLKYRIEAMLEVLDG